MEDGSTKRTPRLVLMVGRRLAGKVVPRDQIGVAKILIKLTMEVVVARPRDHIDNARIWPQVRHEESVVNLGLVNRTYDRFKELFRRACQLSECH